MFQSNSSKNEAPTSQSEDSRSINGNSEPFVPPRTQQDNRGKRKLGLLIGLFFVLILALALGLGLGLGLRSNSKAVKHHKGPNVLVIMADDQGVLLDSMSVMPNVNSMIGDQGVTYQKHYCTVAWCCPSRVNFLTGRAAHNTNVTSTGPPYRGWQKLTKEALNDNYLLVWMNGAGVNTYYVGKLMNGYAKHNLAKPAHPKGGTDSSFLVDPWTYNYYNSRWTNGYMDYVTPYKGIHTTDVIEDKALRMLDDAIQSNNQFFMMVAPVAPHQEIANGMHPPPVPDRWKGNFSDEISPRTGNFNPDEPSGASWVHGLTRLDDKEVKHGDKTHRYRLGNIAAIDEMVRNLIQKLDDHETLDNTYILYTSDNGFHISNHRLAPGKRCPYEEDINIPLLIRGPDVPNGVNSSTTNSHTDMAPTILQMLRLPLRDEFDRAPIAYTDRTMSTSDKYELVNVESWDSGHTPIGVQNSAYYNNTYKALRLVSNNYSFFYSKWCTGEREFYDMKSDFVQMNNRLGSNPIGKGVQYYGRPETELFHRLDALLMVSKSCKQDSCRDPWGVLFPNGEVTNLEQAMNSNYDNFFTNQPKVTFSSCVHGHIISEEGPQNVLAFTASSKWS